MTINELYSTGIERIYSENIEDQRKYFEAIGVNLRNIKIETLEKANMFYVPNNEFMIHFFGQEITYPSSGCYLYGNQCIWQNFLVAPMYNVIEEIVGFVGFNPYVYTQAKELETKVGTNYYSYSTKSIMQKGNYLYSFKGEYARSLETGYTCVVDGFFDALSLLERGYHAHAFLASNVSNLVIAQLRYYKKVIFISDNDRAGVMLYKKLSRYLDNLVWLKQDKTKDVDALLKTKYEKSFLAKLDEVIENTVFKEISVDFKNLKI